MCACASFQVPSYSLAINAGDSGVPPLSSTTVVNIDLSDINDNAPFFALDDFTVVIQVKF